MSRNTRAVIDLSALRHNYARLKALAPGSQVMAVVKADGYGHGISGVAAALPDADAFGVAYIGEAIQLRDAGISRPIVLLEGVMNAAEYVQAAELDLWVVVHQREQLDWLKESRLCVPLSVWLKVDTGMHRLGVAPADVEEMLAELQEMQLPPAQRTRSGLRNAPTVASIVVMSHLACADEQEHAMSNQQRAVFTQVTRNFAGKKSLANSAGILLGSAFHHDWVRPGIMLYGCSPRADKTAEALGLKPVMRLLAPVISVRAVAAGESVGYGASWVADKPTRVGIVAIGYGDGYPRHVDANACVVINNVRCKVLGRVSMDMIAVDITQIEAQLGDEAELWGPALPVEAVAGWAHTLNYELLCQVTDRVRREYR